jgi:hypothetical protein
MPQQHFAVHAPYSVALPPAARSFTLNDGDPTDIRVPALGPTEKVVRPVLAVLFRVAIGPHADRYAPRFLAYERAGGPVPGWHWPSLLVPTLWAFYRRLWLSGFCFALLRVAAVVAFVLLLPSLEESSVLWHVFGALLVLIVPGIVPAALADWLLYRRVRTLVRQAEAHSKTASEALAKLGANRPTSGGAAVLLTFAMICAAVATLGPTLWTRYNEQVVRFKVADTLAAVHWLQEKIDDARYGEAALPTLSDVRVAADVAKLISDIDVSPLTGRVWLGFSDALPQLAGKRILLAPLRDEWEQTRWMCIPVDIPAKYLPKACQ